MLNFLQRTLICHFRSEAIPPIPRLALVVHDRNDKHVVALDGVKNRVREDTHTTAADVLLQYTPTLRRDQNSLYGASYFSREAIPKRPTPFTR